MGRITRIVVGDLGGTNSRGAMVECTDGELHLDESTYVSFETNDMSIRDIIDTGFGRIVKVLGPRKRIHGMSWAVAGPVDNHTTLLNAPNIKSLNGRTPVNLARKMEKILGISSIVCNDLEAALDGERQAGSLKPRKGKAVDWALLENIGTGYGGARLYNGVPVAAEPGHVWYPGAETTCGCGKEGCVESTLSGGAIENALVQLCKQNQKKVPPGVHICAFADQAAEAGEKWAVDFYTDIASSLGRIWGSKLNDCPEFTDILYMGSFLSKAMNVECFRREVRESMIKQSMFPKRHRKIRISPISAPVHKPSGQPLGPLLGAAGIWMRKSSK